MDQGRMRALADVDRSNLTRWAPLVGFILLAAVSVARDLSFTAPTVEAFIGHADQANVADAARNIVEGRGPVVNNHWLLTDGGLPETSLPHAEPYWSIYLAYAIAAVMVVVGPTLGAVLLAASLTKVAIAAVCARAAWRTVGPTAGAAAAVVLLYDRSMVARVRGWSDIYWALAATVVFVALWWALHRPGRVVPWLLAGLATGVGFGFRLPSGLLVGPIVGVGVLLLWQRRGRPIRGVALAGAAAAVGAAPYVTYNLVTGGSFLPPGLRLVRRAGAIRRMTWKHDLGFYGFEHVEVPPSGFIPPPSVLADNAGTFLGGLASGDIASGWLVVSTIVAVVALLLWVRRRGERLGRTTTVVLGLGAAWGAIGLVVGAMNNNFESRYWTFLVPIIVLVAVVCLARVHRHAPGVLVLVALVFLAQQGSGAYPIRAVPPAYSAVAATLPEDAVVLSSDPWEFAFHTRHGAVAVPFTRHPEVVEAVARHFGATHLAVVEDDVRNRRLGEALEAGPPTGWDVAGRGADWAVYELPDDATP